jgi:hypothetical protein
MQSTAPSRSLMLALALALAGALPQFVCAGQEELVSRHRFMRAELIGALYLPGNARKTIATVTSPNAAAAEATISTGANGRDDVAMHAGDARVITP